MKQKIVLKLQMDCDKCRSKALNTATKVKGVTSVSLEGDDKDQMAVIGDHADMICLANKLKKKFPSAIILSLEDLRKKEEEEKKKKEEAKKKEEEEKKKKEEELKKIKAALCAALCHRKCGNCSKCECSKCSSSDDQLCLIINCSKCQSSNCGGECKPCPNCHSHKCHGCKTSPPPCKTSPTPSFYPYPTYNPYPPSYHVVYNDPCPPETCSIM